MAVVKKAVGAAPDGDNGADVTEPTLDLENLRVLELIGFEFYFSVIVFEIQCQCYSGEQKQIVCGKYIL